MMFTCSQNANVRSYPEAIRLSQFYSLFLKIHFNIILVSMTVSHTYVTLSLVVMNQNYERTSPWFSRCKHNDIMRRVHI